MLTFDEQESLLGSYQRKGWATDIKIEYEDHLKFIMLDVQITLTSGSINYIPQIVELFFSYIKLIKVQGITPEYF